MDILLSPAQWTPEWVAAVSGVVAAIGAVGAFTLAFILVRKQYAALDATSKALNEEMEWRRQERDRQQAEQARKVRLEPFEGWADPGDTDAVAEMGVFIRSRVRVINDSHVRIRSVVAAAELWVPPQLCAVDGQEGVREDCEVAMIPPGKSARFYWVYKKVDDLKMYVDFTDEAGVRWRLHHRDGLSEVTNSPRRPAPDEASAPEPPGRAQEARRQRLQPGPPDRRPRPEAVDELGMDQP